MAPPRVVLHHFLHSHYNEKARWGLDWKGVPHARKSHLPGPHAFAIERLSGQTSTPVLVIDGEVIAGSARILDALERRHPERPLYPADPELRRRALAIQERFDREVGPAVRTVLFSVLVHEPGYLCAIFAGGKPLPGRLLYRATLPFAKGVISKANGVDDPAGIARAHEVTRQALDFVAKEVDRSGQLVGDAFSIADLACASLLAILTHPSHPDMDRPRPVPERVEALLARFSTHPALSWVLEQYRRHRPTRLPDGRRG
jgi:glutathione S-transferase